MEYRKLGKTDISVSSICLGTMTWGEQNSEQEAHEQMDYAFSQGINFLDAAEMYPVPPKAETQGRTEAYIGSWLQARKCRSRIILATKVVGRSKNFYYLRGGETRLNKEQITIALDASLRRLQTDYIDLYQLHWPERQTNYFGQLGYKHVNSHDDIPISETLEVLARFVKQGKIRFVGLSNESAWGTMEAIRLSDKKLPRIVSVQNPYSLLNRSYEIGLAEISIREECGLLAYSPLAFGVLTGKYLGGEKPKNARLTLFDRFQRYTGSKAIEATEHYVAVAKKYGISPTQMALKFVTMQPFVTSNIIGATNLQQLEENIKSEEITLLPEILAEIEEIHTKIPNPSP